MFFFFRKSHHVGTCVREKSKNSFTKNSGLKSSGRRDSRVVIHRVQYAYSYVSVGVLVHTVLHDITRLEYYSCNGRFANCFECTKVPESIWFTVRRNNAANIYTIGLPNPKWNAID